MSGDQILAAARALLEQQPSADILDQELATQLRMAEMTQIQLRADIRKLVSEYREWRREARCGRAATDMQPASLPMLKQIRAGFATYRLTQMLLRDMRSIALFDSVLPVTLPQKRSATITSIASMPTIKPVSEMPVPANQDQNMPDSVDSILLEELEGKYGPSLAQKLYDELKKAEEINRKSAHPTVLN